jgi:hypothetical protein
MMRENLVVRLKFLTWKAGARCKNNVKLDEFFLEEIEVKALQFF